MRSYKNYSEDFKKAAIQKLLSPNGPGATRLSEDLDLHISTLYSWKQKYASSQLMKKSNKKEWTPEQMLEAIIKTASMSEQELGEYLRSNGLLSSELEAFKSGFINFKKEKKRGRPQLDPELVTLRKQNKKMLGFSEGKRETLEKKIKRWKVTSRERTEHSQSTVLESYF